MFCFHFASHSCSGKGWGWISRLAALPPLIISNALTGHMACIDFTAESYYGLLPDCDCHALWLSTSFFQCVMETFWALDWAAGRMTTRQWKVLVASSMQSSFLQILRTQVIKFFEHYCTNYSPVHVDFAYSRLGMSSLWNRTALNFLHSALSHLYL